MGAQDVIHANPGASVKPSISTKFVAAAAPAPGAALAGHARSKLFVTAALVLAGALAAGVAQARNDVQWSVTVATPVYTQPVYQPAPVYYPAPVYRPAPVYQPAPSRHWRGRDHHDQRDYRDDGRPHRNGRVFHDADRDGIPNGRDTFDNRVFSRHDVDGDGVPNWKDSRDNRGRPIWWREGYHPSRDEVYGTPYRRH